VSYAEVLKEGNHCQLESKKTIKDTSSRDHACSRHKEASIMIMISQVTVGRLVVVIDVNPSHGFWTARLMKVFGHEGKCTCRYNTHGWIVYIMLFLVVCGMSRGSSWLRRNEFLKMTK
jgi:hypothetical protein